ncbi:MAG: molybdopterin-binding oxidoreductase [Phenylobacterium sp.]|nr:MAG: molybdopterin-binding oxidoreductase [Phenylobacterium sp.]
MRPLILAAAIALVAAPAFAQTLKLTGPDGRTAVVSEADLAAMPRVKFVFDAHGQKHEYEGPLLIDLMARVGAPTGKAVGGREMADVILVTAMDGYQVALGLAEADPGTRPNRIIVADRSDGAPLSAKEGPFKLVIEGDVRPARSARMVSAISLIRLGTTPRATGH